MHQQSYLIEWKKTASGTQKEPRAIQRRNERDALRGTWCKGNGPSLSQTWSMNLHHTCADRGFSLRLCKKSSPNLRPDADQMLLRVAWYREYGLSLVQICHKDPWHTGIGAMWTNSQMVLPRSYCYDLNLVANSFPQPRPFCTSTPTSLNRVAI